MATIQTKPGDGPPSDMLRRHGDLTSAYQSAHARHSGVPDTAGNDTGYGAGLGGQVDNAFSTSGYNDSDTPSDSSGYGKGVGKQTDKTIVRREGGGDSQPDTGQSGGRVVA